MSLVSTCHLKSGQHNNLYQELGFNRSVPTVLEDQFPPGSL